jgi:hypothetical protein
MAYITSDRKTRILARIAAKEAALASLDAAFDEVAVSGQVQSYRLASGEGATSTEYRSLHEIRNNIRILEREIEHLYAKIDGTGLVKFKLRRKIRG